jgi:hypothetical protein
MDVDAVRVAKLTPDERKRCIEKGLCFRCRKSGHLSNECPHFPSSGKKGKKVQKVSVDDVPELKEIEDDDEEDEVAVRKVHFSWDF